MNNLESGYYWACSHEHPAAPIVAEWRAESAQWFACGRQMPIDVAHVVSGKIRDPLAFTPKPIEMRDFAMRDFGHEAAVRQAQAMEEAIAKGDFPVQVGPLRIIGIDKEKKTIRIQRPGLPYSLAGND